MLVSEHLANTVGVAVGSEAWRAVHEALVDHLRHVLSGFRTSDVVLGMGLGLPTQSVSELRGGRGHGLRVDQLLRVLEKLELPISLDAQPDGRIGVGLRAPGFKTEESPVGIEESRIDSSTPSRS
jgi:hypothetical protein